MVSILLCFSSPVLGGISAAGFWATWLQGLRGVRRRGLRFLGIRGWFMCTLDTRQRHLIDRTTSTELSSRSSPLMMIVIYLAGRGSYLSSFERTSSPPGPSHHITIIHNISSSVWRVMATSLSSGDKLHSRLRSLMGHCNSVWWVWYPLYLWLLAEEENPLSWHYGLGSPKMSLTILYLIYIDETYCFTFEFLFEHLNILVFVLNASPPPTAPLLECNSTVP